MASPSKHLKAIGRRIEYLQGKVSEFTSRKDADHNQARLSWIKAEIAALTWALPILQTFIDGVADGE